MSGEPFVSSNHMKLDLREQSESLQEVRVEFYPSGRGSGELYIEVDGKELAITSIEMSGSMMQIKIEERWG